MNCELCIQDYYRPLSVSPAASQPCVPCSCSHEGTLTCIQYGKEAGKCICSDGYSGENCDKCAVGYYGWPKCEPCTCDARGILNSKLCGNDCLCKVLKYFYFLYCIKRVNKNTKNLISFIYILYKYVE